MQEVSYRASLRSFRDLDRMTEQLLGAGSASSRVPRFMPMDLYRSGDHYVLHADLPGIDPGSVDVNVDNGTLTIRAERSARTEQEVQWLANERFTGPSSASCPSATTSTAVRSAPPTTTACCR